MEGNEREISTAVRIGGIGLALMLLVLFFMVFCEIQHPDVAHAQNGPTGGNPISAPIAQPAGVIQRCSGSGTLSGGTLQLTAPCMANFAHCAAAPVGVGTPATNNYIQCGPTEAATGSPAATQTVVELNAPTANATPGVVWYGVN